MLQMFVKSMVIFKKNNIFGEYPCVDYLHNALLFISYGNSESAYSEICHAIMKSGGELREDERKHFDKINQKY